MDTPKIGQTVQYVEYDFAYPAIITKYHSKGVVDLIYFDIEDNKWKVISEVNDIFTDKSFFWKYI